MTKKNPINPPERRVGGAGAAYGGRVGAVRPLRQVAPPAPGHRLRHATRHLALLPPPRYVGYRIQCTFLIFSH